MIKPSEKVILLKLTLSETVTYVKFSPECIEFRLWLALKLKLHCQLRNFIWNVSLLHGTTLWIGRT